MCKYEDLVRDPGKFIREIESFLTEDLDASVSVVTSGTPIDIQKKPVFFGNRILERKSIVFDPNVSHRFSLSGSWIYWITLGWLMKPFGYSRKGNDSDS